CFSLSHGTQNDVSSPPLKASTMGSGIASSGPRPLPGNRVRRGPNDQKEFPRGACILKHASGQGPEGMLREYVTIGMSMQTVYLTHVLLELVSSCHIAS